MSSAKDVVMTDNLPTSEGIDTGTSSGLLKLSAELKLEVISYIKSPVDLRSLCLVCKAIHPFVIPDLYKKITLPVYMLNDRLRKFLHPRNQGLADIRYLEVKESGSQTYKEAVHGKHLKRLLQALPTNMVEFIWIYTQSEMNAELDTLVLQTQSKLRTLVVHAGGMPHKPCVIPAERISTLASLKLLIKSEADIQRYTGIIHQLFNLEDLSIFILAYFLEEDRREYPVSSRDVVNALFHTNLSNNTYASKFKLKRLYLDGFDFSDCVQQLVAGIDLTCLEELALLTSRDTWMLMEELSRSKITLRSFINDRFEDWDTTRPIDNNFLQSFGGLIEFKRTHLPLPSSLSRDPAGIAWSALESHAETLQILHVDDVLNPASLWQRKSNRSTSEFRKLCNTLTNLEQLAIRPPNADQARNNPKGRFTKFLKCLKVIPMLTSLKLILHPRSLERFYSSADPSTPLPDSVHKEMQELADLVFSELHESCRRFSALVLSVKGNRHTEQGYDKGMADEWAFIRGAEFDEN